MHCPGCGGTELIKRGRKTGRQRYHCRACARYSTDSQPRFSAKTKTMAIETYMNSIGIRAIGRVLGASPAAVLNCICKEHVAMQDKLPGWCRPTSQEPTSSRWTRFTPTSKKQQRAVIWTAYSRQQRRVVAYHIGASKTQEMLRITLDIFLVRKLLGSVT